MIVFQLNNCLIDMDVFSVSGLPSHGEEVRRVRAGLPPDEDLYELADFFKVFGDSTRLKVLCALEGAVWCVSDLADILGMTRPAISHQLNILKREKLVRAQRKGKNVFYALADDHVCMILEMGLEHLHE